MTALDAYRRLRGRHDVVGALSVQDLLKICAAEGVATVWVQPLTGKGYYVSDPAPLIVLREGVGPEVLAHELFHHLAHDPALGPAYYAYDEEKEAREFARLLVGEH